VIKITFFELGSSYLIRAKAENRLMAMEMARFSETTRNDDAADREDRIGLRQWVSASIGWSSARPRNAEASQFLSWELVGQTMEFSFGMPL